MLTAMCKRSEETEVNRTHYVKQPQYTYMYTGYSGGNWLSEWDTTGCAIAIFFTNPHYCTHLVHDF